MKRFWNFAKAGDRAGSLTLYGDIANESWWGNEVTPKQFKEDLDGLGDIDTLDIYVNSGGGDVFAGYAIYNTLKRHTAKKTAYVDGLAASIASVIVMAADRVVMPKNSMMMIHNCWSFGWGNKEQLRKMADDMERIDGLLAGIYAEKSGKDEAEIQGLLDAETWMTAEEALALGLADEVEEGKQIAASIVGNVLLCNGQRVDLSRFGNAQKVREHVPEGSREQSQGACGHTHTSPSHEHVPEGDRVHSQSVCGHTHTWPSHVHTITPENGGESQPVSDTEGLRAQQKRFWDIRKKLNGGAVA